MFYSYLKIAWRNLLKNKVFSLINVTGLSIGLVCCIMMALYLQHELSYDRFQEKDHRIVRVIMEYSMGGSVSKGNFTSTKVMPAFTKAFPELESGVRMMQAKRVVKYGDHLFNEKRFMYADSTFFQLFSFKVLKGNPAHALDGPRKVLLTTSAAQKYFGAQDPVGKVVKVGSTEIDYLVTGVMEDCPSNSQIKFDFLASFSTLGAIQEETYWNANFTTYLLLKEGASIQNLQAKIPGFMEKEMKAEFTGNDYLTYELEPYNKVHLYSEYDGFEPNNSITYIYIIGAVALLMLMIACFTYINLSTARSVERAKEIGIRKVSGAMGRQVFWQFITESLLITLIALGICFLTCLLLLPAFNRLAERALQPSALFSPYLLGLAVLIMVTISLLAGSYPALILSRFQPVKVLKGSFKNTGSGLMMRKSLIVFQFVISVFLIVSTFIIQSQLHYIQNKKLGYDRDHVLVLPMDQKVYENFSALKTEFKSDRNVLAVSKAYDAPNNIRGGYNMRNEAMAESHQIMVTANPVDEEFVPANSLQIIAGTNFKEQDIKDVNDVPEGQQATYHFILNESAARALGWKPEEAIGKKMFLGNSRPGFVKAVIRDFHFATLHEPVQPLVLFPGWGSVLLVKLSGNQLKSTIASLETKWKTLAPHRPFEYSFLDEEYNRMYSAELRLGKVLNLFAAIAVLLACLGLFGLSSYTIQQRIKEIGIRKVLGASVPNIAALLSRDFLKLVVFAALISFPIAWWAMHTWLQDFAYRVNINWWVFLAAGIGTMVVALCTVSFQAIRAGLSNPVKNLRTE
jgi:putative ABC transport system permease protein